MSLIKKDGQPTVPKPKKKPNAHMSVEQPIRVKLTFRDGLEFGGGFAVAWFLFFSIVLPIVICVLWGTGIGFLGLLG